jgi:serine-threonine kinase receptor-associated protein
LTGGKDKIVRIFDVNQPEKEISSFSSHSSTVNCSKYFNQSNLFISCSDDQSITLWDDRLSNAIKKTYLSSEIPEFKIIDSKLLVPCSNSVQLLSFDFELIDEIQDLPNKLESATLSKDGKILITCGEDCDVRIYSMKEKKEMDCHKGHHGIVHSVAFSPTNDSYVSGSDDATIRIHTLNKILKC